MKLLTKVKRYFIFITLFPLTLIFGLLAIALTEITILLIRIPDLPEEDKEDMIDWLKRIMFGEVIEIKVKEELPKYEL